MSTLCYSGTVTPPTIEAPCGGEYISTDCVASPTQLITLDLPAGANQTQINAAIIAALIQKENQIQNLELRIVALETP